MRSLCLVAALALVTTHATLGASQRPAGGECRETNECRRLALDAAARGAYERFHDLVWRAIQTGKPDDPELLYMLARAQSLSNRPHDALVVLRRLADMGTVFDAATNEDLSRARRLPGWTALAPLIEKASRSNEARARRTPEAAPAAVPSPPDASPAPPAGSAAPPAAALPPSAPPAAAAPPAPPAAPVPPPAPAAPSASAAPAAPATAPPVVPLDFDPRPIEDALQFSTSRFVPGGLAYDAVSARFILGSVAARALIVVGEGSSSVSDLVRAESTGFQEVAALEIDRRRGDLWVASTAGDGSAAVLHKLQLISGRNLAAFEVSGGARPVRLVDVAVTSAGTVLVLDRDGQRILRLRSGAKTLEPFAELDAARPESLAVSDDGRTAYVATDGGLLRVDLDAGTSQSVTAPKGLDVSGIERLRWHRGALVAVQALDDGTRRIARLRLNRNGRAVAASTVLHASVPAGAGPTFATITGDDLYFLVAPAAASAAAVDVVVQRLRLQ